MVIWKRMSTCLDQKDLLYRVKNIMYACSSSPYIDLKQEPQALYEKLTKHLLKMNFKHFNLDGATLYVKKVGNTIVYLVVYVDHLLIT